MHSSYIFNNEAIATVALGHYLSICEKTSMAKAITILPFVLHEPTVKKLNSRSYKRSIEEFVAQYADSLVNFNSRFLDFLPLSINALTILYEAEIISIHKDEIEFNKKASFRPKNTGKRTEAILKANETLNELLGQESDSAIYLKLKIQL